MTRHFKLTAGALCVGLILAGTAGPLTADAAEWNPQVSERLIRLPTTHLKKAIDRDFAGSALAGELQSVGDRIASKKQGITDLREAAAMAGDAATRVELKHQTLAEQQAYIRLTGKRHALRRQRTETRLRLYKSLLTKLDRAGRAQTPEARNLVEKQDAVRARFTPVAEKIDTELFASPGVKRSKYATEYARNEAAIRRLAAQVESHRMNAQAEIDGQPVGKRDYLRHQIRQAEADLALLKQEDRILGYMAKLVALNAMALTEEVAAPAGWVADRNGGNDPLAVANNVDLFVD